jgi:hypothetical protein
LLFGVGDRPEKGAALQSEAREMTPHNRSESFILCSSKSSCKIGKDFLLLVEGLSSESRLHGRGIEEYLNAKPQGNPFCPWPNLGWSGLIREFEHAWQGSSTAYSWGTKNGSSRWQEGHQKTPIASLATFKAPDSMQKQIYKLAKRLKETGCAS